MLRLRYTKTIHNRCMSRERKRFIRGDLPVYHKQREVTFSVSVNCNAMHNFFLLLSKFGTSASLFLITRPLPTSVTVLSGCLGAGIFATISIRIIFPRGNRFNLSACITNETPPAHIFFDIVMTFESRNSVIGNKRSSLVSDLFSTFFTTFVKETFMCFFFNSRYPKYCIVVA